MTKQHPLHDEVVKYKPLVLPPTDGSLQVTISGTEPTVVYGAAQGPSSSVRSTTSGDSVELTVSGRQTQATASSDNAVAISIRSNSRVTMNPNSNVGEVEMDEDHSDEEAAVYEGEEILEDSEKSELEEVSEDIEASIVRRGRAQVRGCAPSCACERPFGSRRCECENRANGMCGVNCQCDRSRCRTTVKDIDGSDGE